MLQGGVYFRRIIAFSLLNWESLTSDGSTGQGGRGRAVKEKRRYHMGIGGVNSFQKVQI